MRLMSGLIMTRMETEGSKWYQKPCKECRWAMGHHDKCSKYFLKLSDILRSCNSQVIDEDNTQKHTS